VTERPNLAEDAIAGALHAYGERVLLPAGLGEATRRAAVAGFIDPFAPGNIVDLAVQ
jgi:hypothetical protein